MEKKVSIIIPVYNVERYLGECLDSLLNQTFKDFEVILVDDGSKDSSGTICDQYAAKDNRFKVIHKSNSGVSDTRNIGIKEVVGQYVVFMDSDDTVLPEYIETLYREITEGDFDCVICGYRVLRSRSYKDVAVKESIIIDDFVNSEREVISIYQQRLLNSPWNKIYRRKCINSLFDSSLAMGEDLVFNLQFIQCTKKIKVISNVLYNYIQHSSSAVATYKTSRMKDIIKVNNILIDFCSSVFSSVDYINEIKDSCVNEIDGLLRHLFRGKNSKEERKEIIVAWCTCPEYIEFCKKYVAGRSVLLSEPRKIYKHYNKKTWLERKIVKLLR